MKKLGTFDIDDPKAKEPAPDSWIWTVPSTERLLAKKVIASVDVKEDDIDPRESRPTQSFF